MYLKKGLLLTFAFLVGCASVSPERHSVQRDQLKVDPEVLQAISVTELLDRKIDQPAARTLLQVQFATEAYTDIKLGWKVTWFDASGMIVKGVGEAYRTATVLRGQTRYFTATAPHSKVVDYQLHLRENQQ